MIIVSDNTATDLMYDKVGGIEPVNQLMEAYGLKITRATGTADVWFKALRAAPSPRPVSPRRQDALRSELAARHGQAAGDDGKGRGGQQETPASRCCRSCAARSTARACRSTSTGFRIPHKTGDFLPYIGNDVGILESAVAQHRHQRLHRATLRDGRVLEDAIGRVAELTGNYFAARQDAAPR